MKSAFERPGTSITVTLLIVLALVVPDVYACPVCFGDPDDPMVKATNNGIWVLLGIIFFVQLGFVALFWSFWRRGRELKKFRDQFRLINGGVR